MFANFEGKQAPKIKRDSLDNIFQKVPKNAFFKISPAAQKVWPKQGLFKTLGELGKSI